MLSKAMRHAPAGNARYVTLPYSIDFSTVPDGPFPAYWEGGQTWTISSGKAVCNPTFTNLLTNNSFTTWAGNVPTGWTAVNSTQDPAGNCRLGAGGIGGTVTQTIATWPNSQWVRAGCDLVSQVAGTLGLSNTSSIKQEGITGTGTKTYEFLAHGTADYVSYYSSASGDITIDNAVAGPITNWWKLLNARTANVTVKANVTPKADSSSWVGVIARADSPTNPQNYILALYKGIGTGRVAAYKCVNGVLTPLFSGTGAGANIELRCNGTNVKVYSHTYLVYDATVDESTINNNTYHGLFSFNGENSVNSFFLLNADPIKTVFVGGSNSSGSVSTPYWGNILNWNTISKTVSSSVVSSAVGGAGSWYHNIRYPTEVLPENPQVIFLECSVNDTTNFMRSSRANYWLPSAEALIRHLRTSFPTVPIYYANLAVSAPVQMDDRYRQTREMWSALCAKYDIEEYVIYDWLTTLLGEGATLEQWQAYADGIHFPVAGHEQIAAMFAPHIKDWYPPKGGGWSGNLADYNPPFFADLDDWMHAPIIRAATDNDGETGTWSTDGAFRASSEVGATISWTGTWCSCGINNGYGAGNGVINFAIDGVSKGNLDLSTAGSTNQLYSLERGVHTLTLTVVSGTIWISRFLAT